MKPVESEAFTSYMREKGVDEDKIPTLEKFSQGNIGKGLKLAQSDVFYFNDSDDYAIIKDSL